MIALLRNKMYTVRPYPFLMMIDNLYQNTICIFVVFCNWFNTSSPKQDGRRFPYDIFKRIFLNENEQFSIKISLKFVLKSLVKYIPALDKIMAWGRPGDKPLYEPMKVSFYWCI